VSELRKRHLRPFLPRERDLSRFDWPLEKRAYGLLWLLLPLCLFWWLIDKREPVGKTEKEVEELTAEWNRRRANWVLSWLVLLGALWLLSPGGGIGRIVVGVIAAFRLLEIFVTGLGTILDQSQQVRARNVITILIYAIQAMLIFAILYHSFAATGFLPHPHRPSDFLYISWAAMASLGNSTFTPSSTAARFLEVATTTTSVFLLGVLLAYGIDAVKPQS